MKSLWNCLFVTAGLILMSSAAYAASDVVLYAANGAAHGNWAVTSDSTAAGGTRMASSDQGWSSTDSALASPTDYFELSFSASATTPYHVWIRLKAGSNSKYNDSVYLQW